MNSLKRCKPTPIELAKNPQALLAGCIVLFVSVQCILYVLVHAEMFGNKTFYFQYLSVALCLFFVFPFASKGYENLFIVFSFIFTICADYYLVILPASSQNVFSAMCFFNFTQIFLAAKLLMIASKRERIVTLIIRLFAIVGSQIISILVSGENFDAIAFISVIYFLNLVCSVGFSVKHIKTHGFLFFGLLMFLLCDICVWTMNSAQYFDLTKFPILRLIEDIPTIRWPWLFYMPSQALLALTVFDKNTPLFSVR